MAVKTENEDFLANGVDFKARTIHFGAPFSTSQEDASEFETVSVETAIRAIKRMESEQPHKPITLYMGSYGGSTYHMLALHDVILSSTCQFKFYGYGPVMSSASVIMCICDERYLYPNATVMVHELSDSTEYGRNSSGQVNSRENQRIMDTMIEIYTNNSRMPREFWEEVLTRDVYLTASEAVSLGLADKLVEFKKRGNLRKMRQAALKKEVDAKEFKKLVHSVYERIGKTKHPKIELRETVKEPADPHVIVEAEEKEKPAVAEPQPVESTVPQVTGT